MEGPKGGAEEDEKTLFAETGEKEAEKGRIGGMEKDIGKMKPPRGGGRGAEEDGIKRIGTPEKRGVRGLVEGGKRGSERLGRRRCGEHGACGKIEMVVPFDEAEGDRGCEKGESEEEDENRGVAEEAHGNVQWFMARKRRNGGKAEQWSKLARSRLE